MFRVKICGITNVEDALAAAEAGADAIGLNFYEKSLRHVSNDAAERICTQLGDAVVKVGVFVNASPDAIRAASGGGRWFSHIQLHGNETPEMAKELADEFEIVRVRRFGQQTRVVSLQDDLLHYNSVVGRPPAAYLVDAASATAYGGTGMELPWENLRNFRKSVGDRPLILAGGLNPGNVAAAIHIVRPDGVDVASGVESIPGKKDVGKIRAFVAAAKAALR